MQIQRKARREEVTNNVAIVRLVPPAPASIALKAQIKAWTEVRYISVNHLLNEEKIMNIEAAQSDLQ